MRWEPDVSRGEWLRPLIDTTATPPWTMHCVVPRGFEAYLRIFHPVWQAGDSWDGPPSRWSDAAAHHGTTAHPQMQWYNVVRGDPGADRHRAPLFDPPDTGRLPKDQLITIAEHLAGHTRTPGSGVSAIWEGWGDLFTRQYDGSWVTVGGPDPNPVPGLGNQEYEGPRLQLPQRGYLLFEAGIQEFTGDWITLAPWAHSSHPPSPSILWPDDHAWVLITEVDWDSTVIAGSAELVRELLGDPRLECAQIPPEAVLANTGDLLNP